MLSLIASALGFITGFAPKLMDYFQDKQDKAHELAMVDKQIEAQERVATVRLEEVNVDADIRDQESVRNHDVALLKVASKKLANLSSSIRPIVTYLFVIEYLIITAGIAYLTLTGEKITIETLRSLLDEEFMAILSSILSFWFSSREVRRREGRL